MVDAGRVRFREIRAGRADAKTATISNGVCIPPGPPFFPVTLLLCMSVVKRQSVKFFRLLEASLVTGKGCRRVFANWDVVAVGGLIHILVLILLFTIMSPIRVKSLDEMPCPTIFY